MVTLIHDAQEISILNGREVLDISALNEAYEKRMGLMHLHIKPTVSKAIAKKKIVEQINVNLLTENDIKCLDGEDWSLVELAEYTKKNQVDMVELLRERVSVTEIAV